MMQLPDDTIAYLQEMVPLWQKRRQSSSFLDLIGQQPIQAWTPVISSGTGTITTASATGYYSIVQDHVFCDLDILITNNGTGASYLQATLPFVPNDYVISGFNGIEYQTGLKTVTGSGLSSTTAALVMLNYDGTYPAANGYRIRISGNYRYKR